MPSGTLAPASVATTDLLQDLTDLFENATIGLLLLNGDGTVLRANRALHVLAGLPVDQPEASAGVKPTSLFAGDGWTRLRLLLDQDGVSRGLRVGLARPSGQPRSVLVDASLGSVGGRGVIRAVLRPSLVGFTPGGADDSDAARWDEELAAATSAPLDPILAAEEPQSAVDQLQDFFDNGPVAVHQVSPEGLMVRANQAQLRMLGHEAEPGGFLGQDATLFYPVPEELNAMTEAFLTGRSISNYRAIAVHADGRQVPVTVFSSPRLEPSTVATRCFLFFS
ncbi:PAS domain-containing protein [Frankia sp. QA3]|uniref:PAS domain-containing protein n=1 Tax=Frankia sp. QA3 TaxID=710111 RepID=UPI000269C04D|nr:PAS domain-containing protein [Frankia sp. QA3]EIV92002.1 hypothetical protein FraQA3DRAFT_1491 [Frankia sp. QA3]